MKKSHKLLLASALMQSCLSGSGAFATEVNVEGKAAGDLPHAREEALADALREAVRVGAGVDVLSTTSVKDFNLDFDRVLSAAFGHVKNYKVTWSSLGKDGIYRIKVNADVGAGTPGMNEALALKQIVQLKQSPRVAFKIEEHIDGVPDGKGYASGWFEQAAQKMQLQVVDAGAVGGAEAKRATRDELTGNTAGAAFRRAGIAQRIDFVIEGKINGRYAGTEVLFGALPEHCFELGAELRVVRPESGEVVASVIVPASDKYRSGLQTKEMAAREVLYKSLDGGKGTQGGMALFRKLFARWMVEVDCGGIKQVEFANISSGDFLKVQAGLKSTDKVSAVWEREFDSKAISHIDVETRLSASDLGVEIQKIGGGALELDRATVSYLQFTAKASGGGTPEKGKVAEPTPQKGILQKLFGK
jgi:hypothetical protein